MWNKPWSYREGFVIVAAMMCIGWLWQLFIGPLNVLLPPANWIIGLLITIISLFVAINSIRRQRPSFLLSAPATLTALVAFVFLVLIMGFTKQVHPLMGSGMPELIHRLGFSSMTASYPFMIIYCYMLLILMAVTCYRLLRFRKRIRDIAFILNHLGLSIFLLFSLIGSGEIKRYSMVLDAESENPEWRGVERQTKELVDLPVALKLKSFRMESFPPKLMLLDMTTSSLIPEKAPEKLVVDSTGVRGTLQDWKLDVLEYLPLSAPVIGKDSVVFKLYATTGGAPATKVRATRGNETREGWVSCGSYLFPYRALQLPDSIAVVMPELEAKKYSSKVEYYIKDGESGLYDIRVNHPLRTGPWYFYQLNYDQEKGAWSTMSELEVVYDPWIIPIYIGCAMMILGALFLLLGPRQKVSMTKIEEKK